MFRTCEPVTVSMQVTTDTCRTRRLLWYENVFDCGTSSPPCATVCEPRMAVPAGEWVSAAGLCMHAVRPAQRRAPSCSASLPPRSACRRRRAAHTWSAPRPRRRTSTRRTACVPPAAPAVCKPRRTPSACAGRVPATYWLLMSGHVVSAPPDYPMTSKNEASGAMFRSAAAKLRACRSALLREAPRRCVPHLPCVGGQQNRSAPLRRLPQSAAGSKRARDAPQHCLTPGRPASAGGGAGGRHGGATRGRAGPPALCRAGRARGQVRTIPAARPRPRCGMRKRPACLTVRAHPPKPQAPTLARARVTVPSAILTSRRQ